MHKGSCLCGAVEYEIDAPLGPIIYCHCSRCRKANGSAFNAVVRVPSSSFRITRGEESLRSYRSDTGLHRIFCSQCGSPVLGKRESTPDVVIVRIGTLDTKLDATVSAHIYVGSKAEWYEIHDDATQYEERP